MKNAISSEARNKIMPKRHVLIIGLKELREHIDTYISQVKRGRSFIVVRRSRPVLKISSPEEESELWEEAVDFTKIKRGGVAITDLLSRL